MTISSDNIRKALDHFEEDNFVKSKEVLSKEIQGRKNEFIKDKLGLQKEIGGKSTDSE